MIENRVTASPITKLGLSVAPAPAAAQDKKLRDGAEQF